MNIKAFIIHLARSTDRGPQVDKLIRELPVKTEVIDAVDSRALADAEIKRVYRRKLHAPRYPFELSKNEIACFLSHRKAWQAIVDQKLDAGFIIEDDIELTAVLTPPSMPSPIILSRQLRTIHFPRRSRTWSRSVSQRPDTHHHSQSNRAWYGGAACEFRRGSEITCSDRTVRPTCRHHCTNALGDGPAAACSHSGGSRKSPHSLAGRPSSTRSPSQISLRVRSCAQSTGCVCVAFLQDRSETNGCSDSSLSSDCPSPT